MVFSAPLVTCGDLHMIRVSSGRHWILPLAVAATLYGCGMQKQPAQRAVAETQAAISSLRSDAASIASDDLMALDESLAALKADLERQDYKAVMAASRVLMARVGAVQGADPTQKAETGA